MKKRKGKNRGRKEIRKDRRIEKRSCKITSHLLIECKGDEDNILTLI